MALTTAEITRQLQQIYGVAHGFERSSVTAGELRLLLQRLDTLTSDLLTERETLSDWLPDVGVVQWDGDMQRWRSRLLAYQNLVENVPPEDTELVRYTIVAPLLVGWYPDENRQRVLDAVTPWILASSLRAAKEAREQRWRELLAELRENAKRITNPLGIPWWGWAIGIGAVIWWARS